MPYPYKSLAEIKSKAMGDDLFFVQLFERRGNKNELIEILGTDLEEKDLDELQFLLKYGRGCVTAEEYLRDKRTPRLDTGGKGVWA